MLTTYIIGSTIILSVIALAGLYAALDHPMQYGRYQDQAKDTLLPVRKGWFYMELPALVSSVAAFLYFHNEPVSLAQVVLLSVWMAHYTHRSLIYPLRIRTRPEDGYRLFYVIFGGTSNLLAGSAITVTIIAASPHLQQGWIFDPRFVVGIAMVVSGFSINKFADRRLIRLRTNGNGSYAIPRGGIFDLVSCPNYLGEIVQWIGFAIAAWNLPAFAFALLTACNLGPRSLTHHKWYKAKFSDYPPGRSALIPWLL